MWNELLLLPLLLHSRRRPSLGERHASRNERIGGPQPHFQLHDGVSKSPLSLPRTPCSKPTIRFPKPLRPPHLHLEHNWWPTYKNIHPCVHEHETIQSHEAAGHSMEYAISDCLFPAHSNASNIGKRCRKCRGHI